MASIRDLLEGPAHPSEGQTLRDAAKGSTEWVDYLDPLANFTARLPGDDPSNHPLACTAQNPIPGKSVLDLLRLIRAGALDADTERKARIYVDQHYKFSGDGSWRR